MAAAAVTHKLSAGVEETVLLESCFGPNSSLKALLVMGGYCRQWTKCMHAHSLFMVLPPVQESVLSVPNLGDSVWIYILPSQTPAFVQGVEA